MTQSSLESFERTLHETNIWLKELCDALDTADRQRAYRVLKGVLHALRDRLTVNEAVQLGAQFPTLVRGFYFEGWRPADVPLRIRSKEQFLELVTDNIRDIVEDGPAIDVEHATKAVFELLGRHVTQGELSNVLDQLPEDIRGMYRSG